MTFEEANKAFDHWNSGNVTDSVCVQPASYRVNQRKPFIAGHEAGWNACDAQWRERLGSERMFEKIAKEIAPTAFLVWEQHVKQMIDNGETEEKAISFAQWCEGGAHPLGRVSGAREKAKAVLQAILEGI